MILVAYWLRSMSFPADVGIDWHMNVGGECARGDLPVAFHIKKTPAKSRKTLKKLKRNTGKLVLDWRK